MTTTEDVAVIDGVRWNTPPRTVSTEPVLTIDADRL